MHLPRPIDTYFSAGEQEAEAFAAAFAPDAIVHDEGICHRGPEEITRWWRSTQARYRHTSEPLDVETADGKTLVRARVSGDFPGSPVVLMFRFGLAADRITDLEIG